MFNAPKAAALRLIGLPALALVVVEAAVRRRDRVVLKAAAPPPAARALNLAVIAWAIAAGLSTVFGLSPRLSLFGEIEQREGLLTVLALAGLYAAVRASHRASADVRRTLQVAVACGALASAYAMLQRAGLDWIAWAPGSTYPVAGGEVLRPFSTIGNAVLLGALLAATVATGVALAASAAGAGPWLLPSLALGGAAIAATLSRGAMLAVLAGVVAALAAAAMTGGAAAMKRFARVLAWTAVPAALWAALALRAPLAARLAESLDPRAESAPARMEMAKSALTLFRRRPLLGVGPDAFGLAFPSAQTADYWRNSWIGNPAHAHSAALQLLATGGVLMALVALAWGVALAVALWPRRSEPGERANLRIALAAGAAALVVAGAINPVGLSGATLWVVLSALAATLAPAGPAETIMVGAPPRTSRLAVAAALAVAMQVRWSATSDVPALAAAHRAQEAQLHALETSGDAQVVVTTAGHAWARRATDLDPGEDELWRLRADAALAAFRARAAAAPRDSLAAVRIRPAAAPGDTLAADALASARRALALEPARASNLQRLANALAAGGAAAAADSAFAAAERAAPYDAFILLDHERAALESGRPERALAIAQRIVALYPEDATGHAVEAGAWLTLGRRAEAKAALGRALAARWEAESDARHAAAQALFERLSADSTR